MPPPVLTSARARAYRARVGSGGVADRVGSGVCGGVGGGVGAVLATGSLTEPLRLGLENLWAARQLFEAGSVGNTFRPRKMPTAHRLSARWVFLFSSGHEETGGDGSGL